VSFEGLHVAIPRPTARRLDGAATADDHAEVRRVVRAVLDSRPAGRVDSGWYWEALRRCLCQGTLGMPWEAGPAAGAGGPRADAILGGAVVFDRLGYVLRLATLLAPDDVIRTAAALESVSLDWLHDQFKAITVLSYPTPIQPGRTAWFANLWERFIAVRTLFTRAADAQLSMLFLVAHLQWRPPRVETTEHGRYVVRRPFRAADYTVPPSYYQTLPMSGGDRTVDWELTDRDGAMHGSWREVRRFVRNGRLWVRIAHTASDGYYLDVDIADAPEAALAMSSAGDLIRRIETLDPADAYAEARREDGLPLVVEDW
jgi:hypothetical protein